MRIHRVRADATLLPQLCPELPRKSEVRGMVAVQVADLMAVDPKAELAAAARTGLHAGPGGDLFRNLLASSLCCSHAVTVQVQVHLKSRRKWRLVGVPYTSAQAPGGIARAIKVLRSRGLAERLGRLGVVDAGDLRLQEPSGTRGPSGLLNEAALGELVEATRAQTHSAREHGDRLLLIGGDCPVMVGALAGMGERRGLLMLDGHEDAWLPAQSPTGEASDSELAIALGIASDRLPAPLDDLVPLLDPGDVALLGPRDRAEIDAAGARSVQGHLALFLSGQETSRADSPAATALRALETPDFWLHIDLDVLATDAFGAADYLQPGGLTWGELDAIAGTAVADARCRGASVVIYNPELDPDRHAADQVIEFVCRLIGEDA
jgi:arginase